MTRAEPRGSAGDPRTLDPRIADALAAAAILAVDPGLGACVRSASPQVLDGWAAAVQGALGEAAWRRLPGSITAERLDGELDLAATLAERRPVRQAGWLAEGGGGMAVTAAAGRLAPEVAARLRRALDAEELTLLALDDDAGEPPEPGLADRLALVLDLPAPSRRAAPVRLPRRAVDRARRRLARVRADDEALQAVVAAAEALGVASFRGAGHCLRAARAAAALAGRHVVEADDLALAVRLTLAPRATRLPTFEAAQEPSAPEPQADAADAPPQDAQSDAAQPPEAESDAGEPPAMADDLLVAMLRGVVLDVLDAAGAAALSRAPVSASRGRFGATRAAARGRPAGLAARRPRRGERLDLVATLRAATPWRALRSPQAEAGDALPVRPADFRVTRRVAPQRTTTIFAVDGSGSAAAERLGEAKGAVERLLARCYARRDEVALVCFRGASAEVRLAPTRSLTRVRRDLAAMPGGGGTPLAAGLDVAGALAEGVRRRGSRPQLVIFTDGRANVARDGAGGRAAAMADALASANGLRAGGLLATVVDTSPRGEPRTVDLAQALGARRLHLPRVGGDGLACALDPTPPAGRAARGAG